MKNNRARKRQINILALGLSIPFALLLIIFIATTINIGIKYDLSPFHTAKKLIRYGFLSAIYISTQIYDTSTVKNASLGPNNKVDINYEDFSRIEGDFIRKNIFMKPYALKEVHNGTIKRSSFHFGYQPYDEPKLHALRKEYAFDDVVASAKTEFEAMILLRNWARSQFRRNDYQPVMEHFDALEVLRKNIRNKHNEPYKPSQYRPCHFFPLFYSQILLSMGYQVRLVRISHLSNRGYVGHGMTEVWSNQFRKWITMDPDLNLHYEKGGIPLNTLEVHNERYEKGPSRIRIVRGLQTSGDFDYKNEIDIQHMIDYHSYIQIIDMRNDWMTNHYFKGHPKRSDRSALFWIDKNLPPVFNLKQKTDNVDDFYWTLNQTEIWIKKNNNSTLQLPLAFKTFTPNFKHFEIIVDDEEKIISTDLVNLWKLHPGANKFLVRSVNKFGVNGIPSSIELIVN